MDFHAYDMPALHEGAAQREYALSPAATRDWRDIGSAPKDGTVVEIMNAYGVAPSYDLYRWTGKRSFGGESFTTTPAWVHARDEDVSISDEGPHLRWRPYSGKVGDYVDPTKGVQQNPAYWRGATAAKGGLRLDAFEEGVRESGPGRTPSVWTRMARWLTGSR